MHLVSWERGSLRFLATGRCLALLLKGEKVDTDDLYDA